MSGIVTSSQELQNGNHHLKLLNGGPTFQDNSNTTMDSEGIGDKSVNSNGSGPTSNGSNVTRNGPVPPNIANDEAKSIQNARSTDLIFLKSVVASNTLERPKQVCCFYFIPELQ